MADLVALAFWIGGIAPAYHRNRVHGLGRWKSSAEATFRPCGVGYRIARDFYVCDEWHTRPADPEA